MKWIKDGDTENLTLQHFDLIIELKKSGNYELIIWDRQMTEDFCIIDLETNDIVKAKEKALKEYEIVLNDELIKYQESISELNKYKK